MPVTLYRQVSCAGQTQRQKVLLLDKREWDGYKSLLVKDATIAREARDLYEKKEAVKIKSKALRKTWRNTQESVRNKQLQARADRLAADEREKEQRSLEMQQIRAEERKQYLDECRMVVHYREDDVRILNTALLFSETLREREAQKKLDKKIKAMEAARHKEWVAGVFRDIDDYNREELEKERGLRSKRVQHRVVLVDQIKEIAATKARDAAIAREEEIEDMRKAEKEIELGKALEADEVRRQQQIVQRDFEESTANTRQAKEARKKQDEDEAKVMFVYADTIARVEAKRREKLAEQRAARWEKMERIAKQVGETQAARDAAEHACMVKAIAERDAKDEDMERKREAHRKKIIAERIQGYQEFLESEEVRKAKERDLVKWELLQGFKTAEVDKAFRDKMKKKHQDGLMANRLRLEKAIEEKRAEIEAAKFDLQSFYKLKDDKQDFDYLKYAGEVVADSKQKGRMLYPIQKAIVQYKLRHGLEKRTKNRKLHVSRVPCGEAKKWTVPPERCECVVAPQKVLG